MHERHGGATDAQRQLDMLSTCSHSSRGNSNTPILILSASAVRVLRMLFHIHVPLFLAMIHYVNSLCQHNIIMSCGVTVATIVARYCQG